MTAASNDTKNIAWLNVATDRMVVSFMRLQKASKRIGSLYVASDGCKNSKFRDWGWQALSTGL